MAAKTRAKPENPSLFPELDQQTDMQEGGLYDEKGSPEEVLLNGSPAEARQLFGLAIQIKELKPWHWMEETDMIGIQNPDNGEIGFISVMGAVGEHEAVAIYLGAEGLHGFIDSQHESNPEVLLEMTHVEVAFSDRKDLQNKDLQLIKKLNLKFRGARGWPMFRSYRPGYLPWFITIDEARFLGHALSQIIDIARCVRDDEQPFHPTGRIEKDGYLMRVPRPGESGLIWEDQVWRIPKPAPEPIRASIDGAILASLRQIRSSNLEFEIDVNLAPAIVGSPNQRPRAVYVLMVVDGDSGFIFGLELMSADNSIAAMYSRIPDIVGRLLVDSRVVPARITVRSDKLRRVLRALAQGLNVELRQADELPSISEAMESMASSVHRGRL